jgi:pimeloyl-ACP methyl ester carboxylesterase
MSGSGNPANPPPAPQVMALLTRQPPHPHQDEAGFLAHRMAFARLISGGGYPFDEAVQRSEALAEVRRSYDPAGFSRQIAAMATTGDIRKRLAKISAPTLVMHGSDDPLIAPDSGKDTAASIKDAELLMLDGMGHEIPPLLYETIAAAIASNARRAGRTGNSVAPVDPRDPTR